MGASAEYHPHLQVHEAFRMKENADVFDFTLSPEEMDRIFALGEDGRTGPNPDHIDF